MITTELSVVEENLKNGLSTVYSGQYAEASVKSFISDKKYTLLKSFTVLDEDVGDESPDLSSLPLRFNAMKMGVLGTSVPLLCEKPSLQLTDQVDKRQTKTTPIWNREAILVEVKKSVAEVASCGSSSIDFDQSISLMDAGLDSLAMADFTSILRS